MQENRPANGNSGNMARSEIETTEGLPLRRQRRTEARLCAGAFRPGRDRPDRRGPGLQRGRLHRRAAPARRREGLRRRHRLRPAELGAAQRPARRGARAHQRAALPPARAGRPWSPPTSAGRAGAHPPGHRRLAPSRRTRPVAGQAAIRAAARRAVPAASCPPSACARCWTPFTPPARRSWRSSATRNPPTPAAAEISSSGCWCSGRRSQPSPSPHPPTPLPQSWGRGSL